jgi:hypothetical protein
MNNDRKNQEVKLVTENYNRRDTVCLRYSLHSLQIQAQDTERQIKGQFKKLYLFLQKEDRWIDAVRMEEVRKSQVMKHKITEMSREISSLSYTIKAT